MTNLVVFPIITKIVNNYLPPLSAIFVKIKGGVTVENCCDVQNSGKEQKEKAKGRGKEVLADVEKCYRKIMVKILHGRETAVIDPKFF